MKAFGSTILGFGNHGRRSAWLEAQGADAIVAQGFEAGGHRGMFLTDDITTQVGTFALLPQIVKAVETPGDRSGRHRGRTGRCGSADARCHGGADRDLLYGLSRGDDQPNPSRCSEERSLTPHRAYSRLLRPPSSRHCKSYYSRAWPNDRSRARVPLGSVGDRTAARKSRKPGRWRFLAPLVRPKCDRLRRSSCVATDARTGGRFVARAARPTSLPCACSPSRSPGSSNPAVRYPAPGAASF